MRSGWNIKILWAGILALAMILSACGKEQTSSEGSTGQSISGEGQETTATMDIFAMDTVMTLTATGLDAEAAVNAAVAEIQRLDDLWSVGNTESEIARLNSQGQLTLSEETGSLMAASIDLYQKTGGVFDITIYPLMEAWGFTTGEFRVPEADELETLLAKVDAGQVEYNEETREVTLPEGVQVDLGGIAKGYTSGRVMEIFEEYGITSGIVSLGGNVQTWRTKSDGSLWRVGIRNPDQNKLAGSEYVGVLSTADRAVITSGGYERYFEEDGVTYHHILDPATGYPADAGLISMTIVSENGTLADGLSTSLFIMGKEKAIDFWRDHADAFDVILVEANGSITITEGIEDYYESKFKFTVEKR